MKKLVGGFFLAKDIDDELNIILCEACARLQVKFRQPPKGKKHLYRYVRVHLEAEIDEPNVKREQDATNFIVDYLREKKTWVGPQEIGLAYGNARGSAWASPKCKALVARGALERNEKGWYRLALTQSARKRIEDRALLIAAKHGFYAGNEPNKRQSENEQTIYIRYKTTPRGTGNKKTQGAISEQSARGTAK